MITYSKPVEFAKMSLHKEIQIYKVIYKIEIWLGAKGIPEH